MPAGAFLVFAATDDAGINAQIVAAAHTAGALVNDAGEATRGDFATPAVHRSGALTVSVGFGRPFAELHQTHPG